uniref:Uncharacterized protein n=1 Tax=viral metagenome TaxID=1070528 RepID=A0A6C0C2Z0_9ZZZZ
MEDVKQLWCSVQWSVMFFPAREKMTRTYEDIVKELNAHSEAYKQENEKKRALIARKRTQLTTLLHKVTNSSNAFDDEDRNMIQLQLKTNEQEAVQLEAEIAQHNAQSKEENTLFKCMEVAIQERSKILEIDDECLTSHPDMLHFFARKQVSLQMLLASKMTNSAQMAI